VQAVRERGAVVEAAAEVVLGSPTASILVEPSGSVRVVATMEQIFSPAYCCVGHTFPQTSVVHSAIADAALAVGDRLSAVRFMGVPLSPVCLCLVVGPALAVIAASCESPRMAPLPLQT
jgi:hypothetical protein